jgi:glycosyltransferase involved in cell wall biosynthesis
VTDLGTPLTTVVIPAWDRYVGPRMSEAIESVRAQDRPVRLLVVDNASIEPLPSLREGELLRTPTRLTLGAARNVGLEQVDTPYVMLWDADDLMEPGTLRFLEEQLANEPALVAFGAGIIEDPYGVRHRWPRPWIKHLIGHPRLFALLDAVWSMFPTTGATLMRTDIVRACGGYADADSGDDWCLGAALAFRGRFGWSERPGRHYLQHAGSIWDTYGTARHQLAHAAAVRERLAHDDLVPAWLRTGLPLVALAQWSAVGAHLGAAQLRAAVRRRPDVAS